MFDTLRSLISGSEKKPKRGRPLNTSNTSNPERDVEITLAYENGTNSQELAEKFGVSRERICQILRRSNVIEHRRERRQAIKAVFSQEAQKIEEQARIDFEQKLAAAIELVRGGKSLIAAGKAVGLTRNKINYLGIECKKAGIQTNYGRWRDFEPKKARCRELRSQNLTWDNISKICISEGLGPVNQTWVGSHLPDLIGRRSVEKRDAPPETQKTPKAPKAAPPLEFCWNDETVSRLIDLWFAGTTAQQCSDIFGFPCTRNAVIGKINRLRNSGQLARPPR